MYHIVSFLAKNSSQVKFLVLLHLSKLVRKIPKDIRTNTRDVHQKPVFALLLQ